MKGVDRNMGLCQTAIMRAVFVHLIRHPVRSEIGFELVNVPLFHIGLLRGRALSFGFVTEPTLWGQRVKSVYGAEMHTFSKVVIRPIGGSKFKHKGTHRLNL